MMTYKECLEMVKNDTQKVLGYYIGERDVAKLATSIYIAQMQKEVNENGANNY